MSFLERPAGKAGTSGAAVGPNCGDGKVEKRIFSPGSMAEVGESNGDADGEDGATEGASCGDVPVKLPLGEAGLAAPSSSCLLVAFFRSFDMSPMALGVCVVFFASKGFRVLPRLIDWQTRQRMTWPDPWAQLPHFSLSLYTNTKDTSTNFHKTSHL